MRFSGFVGAGFVPFSLFSLLAAGMASILLVLAAVTELYFVRVSELRENDKTEQVHVLSIQLIEFIVVLQVNYLSGHPVVSRSRVCFLSPDLTEGGPVSLCFNLGF